MTVQPEQPVERIEDIMHLMEMRNAQSNTLIETAEFLTKKAEEQESAPLAEAARELLRQSTDIDLCNIAVEILSEYPQAHTIRLLEDQRDGWEGVIFCGHIDDENGNKVEDSYHAKEFVEKLVKEYRLADPKHALERTLNLRDEAMKQPTWFKGVANNGFVLFV
jgi:hypothetical protein